MKEMKLAIRPWMIFMVLAMGLFIGLPQEAMAGSVYTRISTTAVSNNASDGTIPSHVSSLELGKQYYLNMAVTSDCKVKTCVCYIRKGTTVIDTLTYTATNYLRYCAWPYTFSEAGDFNLYWVVTNTDGVAATCSTINFNVYYNVSFSRTYSSMSLAYKGSSKTNTISFSGEGIKTLSYKIGTSGVISTNWSVDWDTGKAVFTLTPVAAGSTTVTVYAKNSNGDVITSTSFSVSVSSRSISNCTATLGTTRYTYDGLPAKPSVTVTDGSTTLTSGTDYSLSYSNNTNAGTATVTITGKGNYTGSISKTYTISKATGSVSTSSYLGTYDGSSHTFTLSISGFNGYTVYYSTSTSLSSSNYSSSGSTSKPTRTSSGTSTVYYYVKDNTGNYTDVSGNSYIRIRPKTTVSSFSGTYDGSSHKASVSASGVATLYFSTSTQLTYSNYTSYGSQTLPTRTSVGTTTVYYIAVPSSGADAYTVTTGSTSISISKASMSLSIGSYSGTYDGSSHTVSLSGSGSSNYTIYYSIVTSLGSSNYSTDGSTTKPTKTDTGFVTVYYYVKDSSGNYYDKSGSTYIRIKPKVTVSAYSGTYDGDAHKPSISVSGSATVYYSTSTALTYSNYSNYGSQTMPTRTVYGTTTIYYIAVPTNAADDNSVTTGNTLISISRKSLESSMVVIGTGSYTYDGSAKKPAVSVNFGTRTLVNGTDYTVAYSDNTNAGTATVAVTGSGNYTGTVSKSFTIDKASAGLNFANSSVSKKTTDSSFVNALAKKTDAAVSYSSSSTGVASVDTSGMVTIKGEGKTTITASASSTSNYKSGSASYTLKVVKESQSIEDFTISMSASSYTYTGTAIKPTMTLSDGAINLKSGVDYTVSYSNNKEIGVAAVTVTGMGGYFGTKTATFKIIPGKVTLGTITIVSSGLKITWNQVTEAAGYNVYRKVGSATSWSKIATVSGSSTCSYTDTAVTAGTKYTYTVCATKNSQLGTRDNTGLSKIFLSDTVVSVKDVSCTYDGSSHGLTINVSGPATYTIYYSSKAISASNYTSADKTALKRTKSGVTKVYYYVKPGVSGYKSAAGSASIRILPKVSAKAYSGTYDGSSHKATITVSGGATLYYSTKETLTFSNYSTAGSKTAPSRTSVGMTTVRYIAVPNADASADTCVSGSIAIKISPKKVTLGEAVNSNGYVTVNWTAASGVDGYKVYRKAPGDTSWKLIETLEGASVSSYKDTSVTSGTAYSYTVRAYKGDILGNYNTDGVKTVYLSKASTIEVEAGVGKLTFQWKSVKGAEGYYVYRKAGNANSWSKVATITSGTATSYQDKDVENGTKYVYTVRAYSGSYTGTRDSTGKKYYYLTRPSSLTLESRSGKFKLSWSQNQMATGYRTQYSESSSFSTFGNNTTDELSVCSPELTVGKTYYVRVRSIKDVGDKKYYSAWSEVKSIVISQ